MLNIKKNNYRHLLHDYKGSYAGYTAGAYRSKGGGNSQSKYKDVDVDLYYETELNYFFPKNAKIPEIFFKKVKPKKENPL